MAGWADENWLMNLVDGVAKGIGGFLGAIGAPVAGLVDATMEKIGLAPKTEHLIAGESMAPSEPMQVRPTTAPSPTEQTVSIEAALSRPGNTIMAAVDAVRNRAGEIAPSAMDMGQGMDMPPVQAGLPMGIGMANAGRTA